MATAFLGDQAQGQEQLTKAPAFPEGWFQVAYSDDIPVNGMVTLRYFGRDLVAFRTASGKVQLIDAYCVHLGAHLGIGGKVSGENIVCPYHAWEYGTDGKCKSIPYCDTIPPGAAVKAWPTHETSGLVLMWYSPTNATPTWDPPSLPEFGDPLWEGYTKGRYVVKTSAQELVENIFDTVHFKYVHGNANIPTGQFSYKDHEAHVDFSTTTPTLGGRNSHLGTIHGLGLITWRSTGQGARAYWIAYTPVDRETVEARFSMLHAKTFEGDPDGSIGRNGVAMTMHEFEKDFFIWENKTYLANPKLCKEDGPIGRYRMWAKRFYQ